MRDGERSRQRLLDAATAGSAAHSIAGARVDRVAAAARVDFTAGDLPGYAVVLYGYLIDLELVRLAAWSRLERVRTGELLAAQPGHADAEHAAIAQAQADGRIVPGSHVDEVYALLIAPGWHVVSARQHGHRVPHDGAADHDRRRTVLRGVVRRALVPPG